MKLFKESLLSTNSKIVYATILIILFAIKPNLKSELNGSNLGIYSILFLIGVIYHFIVTKSEGNWFRIDVFFLLGFAIVHFQWPIMFSTSGLSPTNFSRVWVDSSYIMYGTWLSSVGGVSWLFGFSFYFRRKKSSLINYCFNYERILWLSIILFLLFLITAGSDFLSGGVYKGSGGNGTGVGVSAYIQLVFSILILVLTVFIILNNKNHYSNNFLLWILKLDKRYLFLVGSYIFIFLSIGDRGGVIQFVLTFFVLVGTYIRPIKLRELMMFVIIGSLFMTIIGLGRGVDSNKGIITAGIENAEITSGYDITAELANSSRTLYLSLSKVPGQYDYFFGKLWLNDFMSPIPMLQSLYFSLTNDNVYELGSAGFITYLTFGKNPTSGEGTSLIADIYLNLGLPGVILLMGLLGIFLKKVSFELLSQRNINWIVIAALLAAMSFYFGRSGLFFPMRAIIWSFPIVYFLVKKKRLNR